jgi:hypothetical protein
MSELQKLLESRSELQKRLYRLEITIDIIFASLLTKEKQVK